LVVVAEDLMDFVETGWSRQSNAIPGQFRVMVGAHPDIRTTFTAA
jgi:hypothetical protein